MLGSNAVEGETCGWDFSTRGSIPPARPAPGAAAPARPGGSLKARGNTGRWKAWKSNRGISTLPTVLGIAERFPHSHRLDDSPIIKPERKTLLRKVLPMSSDRSLTYVPSRTLSVASQLQFRNDRDGAVGADF